MTNDEIIQIARRSYKSCEHIPNVKIPPEFIERFAKLVAQHERERIFGELLRMHEIASSQHNYYLHAVVTIRERGQA
jgi:hypothetical protein